MLALLVNAVPLVGVLYFDWSAINVLVLYWFENLLIAACTCIRLVMHRRWTRKRGYWRRSNRLGIKINDKPAEMGLIGEYATGAFAFTLAHGIFVGGIALLVRQNYPDQAMWQLSWAHVLRGALAIAVFLGIELSIDLTRIRGASFAALRDYAQARMSRVVVLHLAIIFGMLAMAMSNSPMGVLYVLIALKTLADLFAIAVRGAPRMADYTQWSQIMRREYERLRRHRRPAVLDPYGGESPGEFFGVVSEAFFQRPQALRQHHRELYALLGAYYRLDPAAQPALWPSA